MSGNMSQNKTESSNEMKFDQRINKPQNQALANLYSYGQSLYADPSMSGLKTDAINNSYDVIGSAKPTWKDNLQGGAYSGLDSNSVAQGIQSSLNNPSNSSSIYAQMMGGQGNTYADAMKNTYMQDANRAQNMMLQNMDARAAASGMSGGARHGVATGNAMYDINQNLQQNLARTGYETFDKDLQNKLGIAQMADQNTLARQGMLTDMLSKKQGVMDSALSGSNYMQNLGMGPMNTLWQQLNNYSNIIGKPTILASGKGSGRASDYGFSGGGGM